ncbi:MAG: two-component system sensor histidine kinase RpfC [Gammaproteobacteria bacterium]|jgi:two-component system sensor histidine kinase RpfC
MNKNRNIDRSKSFISPSDIGQSYVRIGVVAVIIVWTFANEAPKSFADVKSNGMLLAMPPYFIYCCLFLFASYWFDKNEPEWPGWIHFKRVIGLFVDLISCGLYIFLSGEYGLAVYPLYVTIIVGYGLRYGFRYLFLAMTVALVTFTLAALYSPLFDQFGSLMIGFYLGIVLIPGYAAILLKKYQDVLKRLSEAIEARARFIANISHELRTPLHAIIGNAEVIGAKLAELEQTEPALRPLSTSARMVSSASEHLRALVDGVLDVASNEAGTFVLGEPDKTDLIHLIRSVIDITQPDRRKKNISVTWFVDSDTPRIVETWEQHLKAVLINTIGNAVKYTEQGSVEIYVQSLPHNPISEISTIHIEIKDTGIGIPALQLATIYEPFSIGDDGRDRRYEGTGLGLTITKQYLDEMGGTINIQSQKGEGTLVEIDIPSKVLERSVSEKYDRTLPAVIVPDTNSIKILESWLQKHAVHCNLVRPSPADLGTADSSGARAEQPSIAFVESTESNQRLSEICDHVDSIFPGIPKVLIGKINPNESSLRAKFLTRIDYGNDGQLHNLFFLIGRAGKYRSRFENSARNILVVDDNETNLQSAQIALESFRHHVWTASSGPDAIEIMRRLEFDLVFMDMHMPSASGLDVARRIAREISNAAPIVMLTADVTKDANNDARIPEIAGFLTKPIRPSELQQAVERYAGARAEPKTLQSSSDARTMPINQLMEASSFSTENYVELLDAGVSVKSINELITKFVEDAFHIVDELHRSAIDGDAESVKALLHKLRGSAGAMHIGRLVSIIEKYHQLSDTVLLASLPRDSQLLKESMLTIASEIEVFVEAHERKLRITG